MTTELVEKVKESRWMKDGEEVRTYYVTLVDGTGEREVPCYSPMGKDLKEDAPLPEGWEVKTSKAGKLYLAAPKTAGSSGSYGGSGKSSWYNSEEGVRFTQERTDRRAALMQAVALYGDGNLFHIEDLTKWAEDHYSFLRKNLDVSAPKTGGPVGEANRKPPSGTGLGGLGADTPLDEDGGASPYELSPSSSIKSHAKKWTPSDTCPICGKGWGTTTTSSGKRLCVAGHVERFG